ncbi:MAG: AAA family ATPase [Firmicutes bacterium]|jgi:exonuclease SbcC|nr:AAA family ATPase [Bacillota bacterium]
MNKLTIKRMTMKNFKCFQEKTLFFPSDKITIIGDNETGKTSIYDAFCWCLFGKNSLGEKTFNYKNTLAKDSENTEVEVVTQLGEREIDFKRIYEAKFTRLKEFNGYSTQCFINGIPKSVKDFEKEVYHILSIGMDEFNLLTNPKFLTEQIKGGKGVLDWQKRRELLYILTSFETDKELVKQNQKFAQLESVLNKYNSVSEFIQAIKFDISKINTEIELMPTRIDQQMKNTVVIDFSVEELQKEKTELQNKISATENSSDDTYKQFTKQVVNLSQEIQDKKVEMEKLNSQISEYVQKQKAEFLKQKNEKKSELQQKRFEVEKEIIALQNKMQSDIKQLQIKYQQKQNEIKTLQNAMDKVQKNHIALENKTLCPVCFNALDKTLVDKNVKMQLNHFQKQKDKCEKELQEMIQEIEKIKMNRSHIDTSKLKEIDSQIQSITCQELDIKVDNFEQKTAVLESEISTLQKELNQSQIKANQYLKQSKKEIQHCLDGIKEIDSKLNIVEQNKKSELLYNQLQQQMQEYLSKKDELQQMYDLSSDFIQFKCQQITESINNCFEVVKWNLFKFNKTDGELKEYCEPEVNSREYKDLSASTKVIAGLDIIKAFQKHFDISLPIFIDNSESITYFPEMDAQTIKLYVQEENCPKCGSKTKRRNQNLLFKCENCEHEFNKKLEVKNG